MKILSLKQVNLSLNGRKILQNLSMDFWKGRVHAVVGPNGAGKSTLAATVMGLEGYRKVRGEILFEGESITNMGIEERAKRGITLAWQEPARFEGLTVETFIRASAREKSDAEIQRVLQVVGLNPDEYRNRAVDRTLSGGERKKIELASILAMRPKLVLLDEPDSGIDVASLENIFEAIRVLRKDGTTVVLITHSLAVLAQAEHAFLICDGTLIEEGPMEQIRPYFEDKCIPCNHKNIPEIEGEEHGDE
ncbi:MAG TPA: ABC transporter ATP-binding protein [Thermoplasmatales archaeon]|nr:MAG: ABC transporter ATP-binding protein [Thermoplasmata archaeon]RLF33027.1 MAG: ABC transporter ATP-binding protein [Thermoplasmata archaeon]HDN51431.1 ABC transporter ATP-binding protein [Thermoplasmatales archaeon]